MYQVLAFILTDRTQMTENFKYSTLVFYVRTLQAKWTTRCFISYEWECFTPKSDYIVLQGKKILTLARSFDCECVEVNFLNIYCFLKLKLLIHSSVSKSHE